MTLFGQDDVRHLTANLDPRRLARLAADLMWVAGCDGIRIVDGPGDGGRDVHAIARDGEKVLAQCKFHGDTSKSCSSAEISELPMALVKFGYKRGVFVTNARLSPQAKRECLDNYPNLQLDFLDGDQLARTVLQHSLLKALWYDGSELKSVTTAMVIPIIIRDHDTDAPIVPSKWDPPPDPTSILSSLSARFPGLIFQISGAQIAPHLLEPYRYPEPFTAEEGMMPFLLGTEVTIRGDLLLGMVPDIVVAVVNEFASFLRDDWPRFTVRVGTPRLTPLAGVQGGMPVEMHGLAAAFVTTPECPSLYEPVFFGILQSGWTAVSDARQTESKYIRLYEPILDTCTTYEIEGRPSGAELAHIRFQNEWTMIGWRESVFALVPKYEAWPYAAVPDPDEAIVWPWDGRVICAWFAGRLVSDVAVPRTINGPDHPFAALVEDRSDILTSVGETLVGLDGVRVLTSIEAIHMVGSLGVRVLVDQEKTVTRTAEVSHFPEKLPSPVLPVSRRLEVLVAWKLEGDPNVGIETDELARSVPGPMGVIPVLRYDEDYLVASWRVPQVNLGNAPTSVILRQVADEQRPWLDAMEVQLSKCRLLVRRATRVYWKTRHGVTLGLHPSASEKVFLWGRNKAGDWKPVIKGRAFNPDTPASPFPAGMSVAMARLISRWPPDEPSGPNS